MARKKTAPAKGGKPMATATEPKIKPIRLDLLEDDHQALRVIAAKAGKSMAGFVRDHVLELIREAEKKGGPR